MFHFHLKFGTLKTKFIISPGEKKKTFQAYLNYLVFSCYVTSLNHASIYILIKTLHYGPMCTIQNTKSMDSFFSSGLQIGYQGSFAYYLLFFFNVFLLCEFHTTYLLYPDYWTLYIILSDSESKLLIWFYNLLSIYKLLLLSKNDLTIVFHKFHFLSCPMHFAYIFCRAF